MWSLPLGSSPMLGVPWDHFCHLVYCLTYLPPRGGYTHSPYLTASLPLRSREPQYTHTKQMWPLRTLRGFHAFLSDRFFPGPKTFSLSPWIPPPITQLFVQLKEKDHRQFCQNLMHSSISTRNAMVIYWIFILLLELQFYSSSNLGHYHTAKNTSSNSRAGMDNLLTLFWPMAIGRASEKTTIFPDKKEIFCQETVILPFTLLFPAWTQTWKLGGRTDILQ